MSCASDVTMTLEGQARGVERRDNLQTIAFEVPYTLINAYQTDLVVRYLMKVVIRPPYLIFHNHRAK